MDLNLTWHETKRKTNIKKHGLDFADAGQVFSGPTATVEDGTYGKEQRFNTTGLLGIKVIVITHTETEREIRIISMREAEKHEIKEFFSYL
jgi:uncharacterized DUF497 family protein